MREHGPGGRVELSASARVAGVGVRVLIQPLTALLASVLSSAVPIEPPTCCDVRRFASKEELIDALFEQQLDHLVALAEQALARDDSWEALVGFM